MTKTGLHFSLAEGPPMPRQVIMPGKALGRHKGIPGSPDALATMQQATPPGLCVAWQVDHMVGMLDGLAA